MNSPKISVVIATFNSERVIDRCLTSLRTLDYPQECIEIIIVDGGSTDNTVSIAEKHHCRIILLSNTTQHPEYNKARGLQFAKSDYILLVDHDNIIPHPLWLRNMLKPIQDDENIVAVEPLRYRYDPSLGLMDRYFALFGVNDPVPYYLGKADRMDYIHSTYNLLGKAVDKGKYYVVTFNKNRPEVIPTLGANGYLIQKKFLHLSNYLPGYYYHIDINVDLVKLGYVKYAFIKDDILHLSNTTFINFLMRRLLFVKEYYLKNRSKRRYSVYTKEDFPKLLLFVVYTVTLIRPFLDSVRGWLKIRDVAWFVHPFMCWAVLITYSTGFIHSYIEKIYGRLLEK